MSPSEVPNRPKGRQRAPLWFGRGDLLVCGRTDRAAGHAAPTGRLSCQAMWGAAMDVGGWLRGLGLGQYEEKFRDNKINADMLPRLTNDDLKDIGGR